jgi:hypothetical protein
MLGKFLLGLAALEAAEEVHDVHKAIRNSYSSTPRVEIRPANPTPVTRRTTTTYQRGGRQNTGYYYTATHRDVVSAETADTLEEIISACSGKLRSIGRELSYQYHRSEKSGWHDNYYCSYATRQEFRRIINEVHMSHIVPHSSDYLYERLADEVINYVRHADIV